MKLEDENITAFDIETNYDLYHRMIDIMTKVDGVEPVGACCGRNKSNHCETFIKNKSKYISIMKAINERTIEPKTNGKIIQVTSENKFYNLDLCSDEEIKHLIAIGVCSKNDFIFTKKEIIEETKEIEKTISKKKKTKK